MSAMLTRRSATTPMRWAETDPFVALHEEMENLFHRFMGPERPEAVVPSIDITEGNGYIQARMDVPGVKPEALDVQVEGDLLTVRGERKEEKEEKGEKVHRVERHYGAFSRTVRLPCTVKEDKVEAQLHDGVLTLKMPKAEETKGRSIKVKAT